MKKKKVYGLPYWMWNPVEMDVTERKIFIGLGIISGIMALGYILVVYPMAYIPWPSETELGLTGTVMGIGVAFLAGLFTVLACRAFYDDRSHWRQLSMQYLSVVGVFLLLLLLKPIRNPFPALPEWIVRILPATFYLVGVTFGTAFVKKEEQLNHPKERFLYYAIRLVTAFLLLTLSVSLSFYFYWGAKGGLVVMGLTFIMAFVSFNLFTDEKTGKWQNWIHGITLLAVPLLQAYTTPTGNTAGVMWLMLVSLMPVTFTMTVFFTTWLYVDASEDALDIIKGIGAGPEPAHAPAPPPPVEPKASAAPPPAPATNGKGAMVSPLVLNVGDKFIHPQEKVTLTVTGLPTKGADELGPYIGVPSTDGKESGLVKLDPSIKVEAL